MFLRLGLFAASQFDVDSNAMPLPWPLSAPWPSLSIPTGFSFASLHDTRHWQRRLLRYVIRRTLGGILQLPEESIDEHTHLDADLGSGNVQLKNVKLDATASPSEIEGRQIRLTFVRIISGYQCSAGNPHR
jgi:hypothetical protein